MQWCRPDFVGGLPRSSLRFRSGLSNERLGRAALRTGPDYFQRKDSAANTGGTACYSCTTAVALGGASAKDARKFRRRTGKQRYRVL